MEIVRKLILRASEDEPPGEHVQEHGEVQEEVGRVGSPARARQPEFIVPGKMIDLFFDAVSFRSKNFF